MTLKTQQMLKIFQPIEKQLKRLSELLNSSTGRDGTEMVSLKKLILDQLKNLLEKFENVSTENEDGYQEMKKKITSIIEEFCNIDFDKNVENVNYQSDDSLFTTIIEKFLMVLENLEKTEIIPLKQNLKDCFQYVTEMGNICEIEDIENIKELGLSFADILKSLQSHKNNLVSNLLTERLHLYCCQLCSSFNMLVQIVKKQYYWKAPIFASKKYICDRICICLEAIICTLDAPNPSDDEECFDQENNFVFRNDLVLDMIAKLSNNPQSQQIEDCKELWLAIEDVFSHAMSIAQVCQPYDFQAITGSCQAILTEYDNLKTQLNAEKEDQTMKDLFINTLTDSLYRLERKINVSVLTLVMEVFSHPSEALKRLVKTCGTPLSAKQRTKDDLNSAIEEFDQLSDKSIQIGKFAIACCRDRKRVRKIKNCLASFESLEMELVPAITAFYLNPQNNEMRASVQLLVDQWQLEMNQFHETVNLIIDPAAYCQIVYDDLFERVNKMSQNLDDREDVTQAQVQEVILRACSLFQQINATLEDIGSIKIDKQTVMLTREFKSAIHEVNAASKKFLSAKATAPEQLRVITRCEMMLKTIRRLLPMLSNVVNDTISANTTGKNKLIIEQENNKSMDLTFPSSIHDLPFDHKSSLYIKTPYSVKSCKHPLSIQPANTIPRNESDISILIPYILKGRCMRTEWSVMYKTPQTPHKSKIDSLHSQLRMKNLSSVRQHLFSRDTFLENSETNCSNDSLDLTNILENISGLSDTLSSVSYEQSCSGLDKVQKLPLSIEKIKSLNKSRLDKVARRLETSSVPGSGDAPPTLLNLVKKNQAKN